MKVIFFIEGSIPTPEEAAAIEAIESMTFTYQIRNGSVLKQDNEALEECDYVMGTVPEAYSEKPEWDFIGSFPGQKVIFFTANSIATNEEISQIGELVDSMIHLVIRNSSVTEGNYLENADFVTGSIPEEYSEYPVWTGGSTIIENPWLLIDFDGLTDGQSVLNHANDPGSVAGKRFDWTLGNRGFQGGYGIQADTTVKSEGRTSSCQVSILEGSDGDPSGGDTGTGMGCWGGAVELPEEIAEGDEFWYGVQYIIPVGFNWNHGSGASKPGFIKFLRVNNSTNGQRLEHHIVNGSWEGNAAADNLQIGWSLASEFDPKSQTETHKVTDKILTLGTKHWVEFYIKAHSDPAQSIRRLWQDGDLIFERVGPNQRWRNGVGIYQTEVLETGEKSLPTSGSTLTSVMHGTYWNGYAPQTQSYYIEKIVAHNTASEVKAFDIFGNRMMGAQ